MPSCIVIGVSGSGTGTDFRLGGVCGVVRMGLVAGDRWLTERRRGAGPERRCISRSQVYGVSAPVIVRRLWRSERRDARGSHDIFDPLIERYL
jgi:hypothetical protein